MKRTANTHALVNVALVGLSLANILLRRRQGSGTVPFVLSIVQNLGLYVGAWFGGHLVYEHGLRVRGVSPVEGMGEWKIAGDQRFADGLESISRRVPDRGPVRAASVVP